MYLYDLHVRAWEALPVEAIDPVNRLLLVRVWHLCYFQLALTNRPPQIAAIVDTVAYENTLFVLQVDATDPDGDSLTYSDDTPLFEIDAAKGLISFSPVYDDIGEHSVRIRVSDGEQSDSTTFVLRVSYVGDFNGDGKVGLADFVLFMNAYGTTTASENWNSLFDLDEDGEVGLADFAVFVDNYGQGGGVSKLVPAVCAQAWMTLSGNTEDPLIWMVRVGGIISPSGYGLALQYDPDRLAFGGLEGDGLYFEHKGQLIVAGRFSGADQDAKLRFKTETGECCDIRAIEAVEGVVLDASGEASPVNVALKEALVSYRLHRSLPNPFNSCTEIAYEIPAEAGTVEIILNVYDLLGRKVRSLVGGKAAAGRHRVVWDGRDDNGQPVASGVYTCRLQTREFAASERMALIK